MLRPVELQKEYPVKLSAGYQSTTTKVWEILQASIRGDMQKVKQLADECPALIYAQYNYAPPIHFAVREGHIDLVTYLLANGAHDPAYKIYPFQESLQVLAADRGLSEIVELLDEYSDSKQSQKYYKGDNGEINYKRSELEKEFETVVDKQDLKRTKEILEKHPEFASDPTYFWSEGILLFAAKEANYEMIDLLMSYGARVPDILKWAQFYYFERYDGAAYIMQKGMNPDTMSCHHVTILHDMAQKGDIEKAELLLQYGAAINPVDQQYQSTPLGMAVRWGQVEMVKYLLKRGADIHQSGALWSSPLSWAIKKGHAEIEKILRSAGAVR